MHQIVILKLYKSLEGAIIAVKCIISKNNCIKSRDKVSSKIGMENSIFQLSSLKELLNLLKSNSDSDIIQKYTDILKNFLENQSCVSLKNDDLMVVIDESVQILIKSLVEMTNIAMEFGNLSLELLILLSLLKLRFLKEDSIEYCNTSFSVFNYGIKLIKYCNDGGFYLKAQYYCRNCKALLNVLLKIITTEKNSIKNILLEMSMTIDIYEIEALSSSDKLNETFDKIQNIQYSIQEFPNHKDYLLCLCYNIGVKLIKKEQYENAIVIIETVQEMNADASISIEICELLAHIFSKHKPEHNWKKCLNVLNSIPYQNLHKNSLICTVKAALLSENPKIIEETLQKIIDVPNVQMELILKIDDDLCNNKYESLSVEFLKNIREHRFGIAEKLHLMSLELKIYFKHNHLERASDLVEDVIKMVQLHQEASPELVRCVCREISMYASDKFNDKSFSEGLNWYKKCSRLLEASSVCDVAALRYIKQRICMCHIELQDVDSAKGALACLDATANSTDPFNLYLALQVAVVAEDVELADKALGRIDEDDTGMYRALLTCCKSAFDSGKKRFLCIVLERMLLKPTRAQESVLHGKVAQCLVRMHMDTTAENEDSLKILTFLKKGLDSLQNCKQERTIELAEWFSRVSWNLALRPGLETQLLFQLSLLCCRFLELARGPASRLRNALLLAMTSGLQMLQSQDGNTGDLTRNILAAIEKYRLLDTEGSTIAPILYVYEFETRLYAKDSVAEYTLRQMLQAPCVDAKTLEIAAAVAYEHNPMGNHQLISMALRGSIQRALDKKKVDCEEVSRLYRSLLQVLFHNQEYCGGFVEDENLEVCEGLVSSLEGTLKDYPQMEALWVMGKCWNWGIQSLATGVEPGKAGDWCHLALRCSHTLQGLGRAHGKQLDALYKAYFGDPNQAHV